MLRRNLSSSHASNLFKHMDAPTVTSEYLDKQTIFAQDDKADAMFYVLHGHVKLTVLSDNGMRAVIAILRNGDMFGEGCLIRQSLRASTATAIKSTTIARIKSSSIVKMIGADPKFARLLVTHLLNNSQRIEDEFVDQVCYSSQMRLAKTLLMLAGEEKLMTAVKIDQETLAEMVGTTRSRVSYFMNRFRDKGLIDYNGELTVHKSLETYITKD